MYTYVCRCLRNQKKESGPLELVLQVIIRRQTCALGTDLESSEGAAELLTTHPSTHSKVHECVFMCE